MKQRRYKCLSVRATTNCFRVRSMTEIHCLPLLRHLRMKLAFHSWRLVQKMPLTSNKLSWLCLLTSRTGLPFFPNHHKIPSLIYVKKCKLPPTFMASLSFYSLVSCFIEHLVFFFFLNKYRMASQPASNNARPPTVQIRGQPVAQKSGCCSS